MVSFATYQDWLLQLEQHDNPSPHSLLTILAKYPNDPKFIPLLLRLTLRLIKLYGYTLKQDLRLVGKLTPHLHNPSYKPVTDTVIHLLYENQLSKLGDLFCKLLTHNGYTLPTLTKHKLQGLTHFNNSCYMDVILMVILALPNLFINENLLYKHSPHLLLQTALQDLTLSLRGKNHITNCKEVRRHLEPKYRNGEMQDAGEFLLYLFDLFKVEGVKYKRTTGHKNIITSSIKEKGSPVVDVPVFTIKDRKVMDLTQALTYEEETEVHGWTYPTRKEIRSVYYAEYLVFYVQRSYLNRRIYTAVVPPRKLKIQPDNLTLTAVIVHKGHHYVAYIRHHKIWYYYDDMYPDLVKLGTYSNLLQTQEVKTHGTLYFYN